MRRTQWQQARCNPRKRQGQPKGAQNHGENKAQTGGGHPRDRDKRGWNPGTKRCGAMARQLEARPEQREQDHAEQEKPPTHLQNQGIKYETEGQHCHGTRMLSHEKVSEAPTHGTPPPGGYYRRENHEQHTGRNNPKVLEPLAGKSSQSEGSKTRER